MAGTHHVFIGILVAAVALTIGVILMPRGSRNPGATEAAETAAPNEAPTTAAAN
jgi:hypothetical protein